MSQIFPSSFYSMLKFAGIKKNGFTTFVVCPNPHCCTLYRMEDCIEGRGEQRESKHCCVVIGKRRCNALLLKKVHILSGKIKFYPFKMYCFRSIKKSLQDLLERPGIYGVPNESKLHHQFLSVFHLLFRVGCSSIVFSDIISDVRYTISDFQYHIRHRIYYIRPPISISDFQYHIRHRIYYIRPPISYRTSYILYLTSNIISDVRYTIS